MTLKVLNVSNLNTYYGDSHVLRDVAVTVNQGEAVVIERVIDVHIGKLRQKIEADPSTPRYIYTVRGMGYRFADGGV